MFPSPHPPPPQKKASFTTQLALTSFIIHSFELQNHELKKNYLWEINKSTFCRDGKRDKKTHSTWYWGVF